MKSRQLSRWKPLLGTYEPRRTVVLLGPVAVGKGFTLRNLEEECESPFSSFGMGDYFRTRLKQDPAFKTNYGELIKKGFLVPDFETIPMAYQELANMVDTPSDNRENFAMEGYFRTDEQVSCAIADGVICAENTLVLDLIAHSTTLRARQIHRLKNKPGGEERFDEGSFENRLLVHYQNHGSVRQAFEAADVHVVEIDADYPLEVFAGVVAKYSMAFWTEPQVHPSNVCSRLTNPTAITQDKSLLLLNDRKIITATA